MRRFVELNRTNRAAPWCGRTDTSGTLHFDAIGAAMLKDRKFYRTDRAADGWKVRGIQSNCQVTG